MQLYHIRTTPKLELGPISFPKLINDGLTGSVGLRDLPHNGDSNIVRRRFGINK